MKYSEEQRDYIQSSDILNTKLIACPGSGKTLTLIHRIVYLVENVLPKRNKKCKDDDDIINKNNIYILTFSRFSRDDLINRIKEIKKYSQYFNTKNVMTIDGLSKCVLSKENQNMSQNIELLSLCFSNMLSELDDTQVNKLFRIKDMKILFVDEAQDLNRIQYNIIYQLMKKNNTKINLIGDPNQNIYQFRHSSDKYLLEFNADRVYYLTRNFRSTKKIIEFYKYLRPHYDNDITTKREDGEDIIIMHDERKNIFDYIIKYINSYKGNKSDIAIVCPTRGIRNDKDIGLSIISNLLNKHKIKFQALYDESGTFDERYTSKKYSKVKDKINLLTYIGTKGLEWDSVFVMDFHSTLMNKLPTKQEHNEQKYLLHVITSRAKNRLFVMCYSNRLLNPWLSLIPTDNYKFKSKIHKKIYIPEEKLTEKDIPVYNISEIVGDVDAENLYDLNRYIKVDNKIETAISNGYKKIDRSADNTLLGLLVEEIFIYCVYTNYNKKPREHNIIKNIITSNYVILKNREFKTLSAFISKHKYLTWNAYDSIKNITESHIRILIDKHYNREVEFYKNIILNNDFQSIISECKRDIKKAYDNYLKAGFWKDNLKNIYYIVLVMYCYNNGHYYYIKDLGKSKKYLLRKFIKLYFDVALHSFKYDYYKFNDRVHVEYDKLALSGIIDFTYLEKKVSENKPALIGDIDDIDDINNIEEELNICEIKCTSDVYIKHFVQLLLYNFAHNYKKKQLDNIYKCKCKILNFYTGKITVFNLSITQRNLFHVMNIVANIGHLKFRELNLILDLEGTGLIEFDAKKKQINLKKMPKITQICLIDYDTNMLVYNDYINIEEKLSKEVIKLTGIKQKTLDQSIKLSTTKTLIKILFENIESIKLYAHNGPRYDYMLIRHYEIFPKRIKMETFDTKTIIPLHINEKLESKSLGNLYKHIFKREITNAHNAMSDVMALYEIMHHLRIKL